MTTKQEPQYDVYARPFVPSNLRSVNNLPATIIPATPVPWVDFPSYVQSFAGTSFLLADPPPPTLAQTDEQLQYDPDNENGNGDKVFLTPRRYHVIFREALIKESIALQQECDEHALFRVPLIRSTRHPGHSMFSLPVPGLRELSLRIEIGDVVQLRQLRFDFSGAVSNGTQGVPPEFRHDATVWGTDRRNETLTLRVDGLLPWSMLFNVAFTIQSGRMGALYRAVMGTQKSLEDRDEHSWMRSMLFPDSSDGKMQTSLNKGRAEIDAFDEMLNYEQLRAIDTVLRGEHGRVPYLISGPPGTGKTKTLVELALQLVRWNEACHLLVCAPSDPAADTLVQRLSRHLKPSQMLRLTSPSRSFPEVPDSVLAFCHIENEMFSMPAFAEIMKRRVVVTTCRDAEMLLRARLTNMDLFSLEQSIISSIHPHKGLVSPALHWTGLLIDEAAQATEPEALIPLSVVTPPEEYGINTGLPTPIFVLAGDQHQLGPRTACKTTMLQTSLFERLLDRPFYGEHPLARSKQTGGVMRPLTQEMLPIVRPAFTNLIRNYRSHPAILATPSALFYYDTLEPEAADTDSLLSWPGWQGRGWPVLFACNSGRDEIEQDGGGWYNNSEARMALEYAQSFVQSGLIQPHEICIMSPFRAQVKVLRHMAKQYVGSSRLNIGPLEAFQGLESRLVILCTTRTRDRFIEQDLAKGLGVIHEPKRFNVALTRAKHGLIVIGSSAVLGLDENWKAFLSFCYRNALWENQAKNEVDVVSLQKGVNSRLEKQLRRQAESIEEEAEYVRNGVRRLGLKPPDEVDELWESGMQAEEAYLDSEEND